MINLIAWTGIAASIGATAHLMLNYRRPTAAIAWLFAVWVLPFLGVALYLMFAVYDGPRRVRRRRKLSRSLRSAERRGKHFGSGSPASVLPPQDRSRLARVCEQVGALPLTSGNEVRLHANAAEARSAVLACLEGAQHEVLLETYIWTTDEFTAEVSEVLSRKVAEGVRVSVLIDAIGSRATSGESFAELAKRGVPCEAFLAPNAFKGRFQINFRNHRKLLVVDGARAITGGRNYGARYFDDGPDGIRDLSIEIRGPAIAALRGVFLEDWVVATEKEDGELGGVEIPAPCGDHVVRVIPHGCDEQRDAYVPILSSVLRSAKDSITIVSPYFVPGVAMRHELEMAALSGIRVRILIPERSPERWPDIAARRFMEPLLEAGVEVWRKPAPFIHAKAIVVDGTWAVVGSANFDERSFFLNYELSCEVQDPGFADAVLAYFEEDFASSTRMDATEFSERGWKPRIVENAAALFAPIL